MPDAEVCVRPLADGGIGMLQALGYGMLNASGSQVAFGAKGLEELRRLPAATFSPS